MNIRPIAGRSGQVLAGALMLLLVLLIVVPAVVNWVQQESRASVKDSRTTTAFNLAEAAVERGVWKLKSSTTSWSNAKNGVAIAGYDFDSTYADVPGGTYRVRFATGPSSNQVTVYGEGRDVNRGETRAIRGVYENSSLPGPLLTSGIMQYSGAFECHWGPAMAQGNITISGNAGTEYFPRKFSKGVVTATSGQNRDTNGLNPPNTDNIEWWSDYDVPDLPLLDFTTLRASAAANGTLNYYNGSTSSHTMTPYPGGTPTACRNAGTSSNHPNPHNLHFLDSNSHNLSKRNLIWYWDGDLAFTGNQNTGCHRNGLWGTVIVRGNLTIETGDCYAFTGPVPANAWMEYGKINAGGGDTAATNQFPADNGFQQVRNTFIHGSQTWSGGPPSGNTDVGMRGFVYVGGNLRIVSNAQSDYQGVIWVNGDIVNENTGERSLVFYDETVGSSLPVLNVVLVRRDWRETSASTIAWP